MLWLDKKKVLYASAKAAMGQTELYREGLQEFRDDVKVKNDHDRALLRDFLEESASPLEAKRQADDLRDESQLKYGKDVGKIPKSWIDNILGNINRFIAVGDYAMKGAPESSTLRTACHLMSRTDIRRSRHSLDGDETCLVGDTKQLRAVWLFW